MANSDDVAREANRLYWQSDIPVTELANRLGVSRGTLYNHTQPLNSGVACASCGGRLVFRNRSGRDSGKAHCEQCSAQQQLTAVPPPPKPASPGAAGANKAAGATKAAGARKSAGATKAAGARKSAAATKAAGTRKSHGAARPAGAAAGHTANSSAASDERVLWAAAAGVSAVVTGVIASLLLRR